MSSKYTEIVEAAKDKARQEMNSAEEQYKALRNAWSNLYDLHNQCIKLDEQAEVALDDLPADPLGMAMMDNGHATYADKHG